MVLSMKDLALLVWFLQLGISVAVPLAAYPLIALWLQSRFGLGAWVIWVSVALGVVSAIGGMKDALKSMDKYVKRNHPKKPGPPPVSFHDHD